MVVVATAAGAARSGALEPESTTPWSGSMRPKALGRRNPFPPVVWGRSGLWRRRHPIAAAPDGAAPSPWCVSGNRASTARVIRRHTRQGRAPAAARACAPVAGQFVHHSCLCVLQSSLDLMAAVLPS